MEVVVLLNGRMCLQITVVGVGAEPFGDQKKVKK